METPLTNREIMTIFEQQKEDYKEIKGLLVRIEKNTEKIGERVTDLEKRNEKKDGANSVIKYIGMGVAGIVISYLAWVGIQVFDIKQTLSQYEIRLEP